MTPEAVDYTQDSLSRCTNTRALSLALQWLAGAILCWDYEIPVAQSQVAWFSLDWRWIGLVWLLAAGSCPGGMSLASALPPRSRGRFIWWKLASTPSSILFTYASRSSKLVCVCPCCESILI